MQQEQINMMKTSKDWMPYVKPEDRASMLLFNLVFIDKSLTPQGEHILIRSMQHLDGITKGGFAVGQVNPGPSSLEAFWRAA